MHTQREETPKVLSEVDAAERTEVANFATMCVRGSTAGNESISSNLERGSQHHTPSRSFVCRLTYRRT
eukprot:1676400-Pleurochrysis_carterae.AAC.1